MTAGKATALVAGSTETLNVTIDIGPNLFILIMVVIGFVLMLAIFGEK